MKKPYYLLTVYSPDLVFGSFEEKYPSKKESLKALELYKTKYRYIGASIRYCRDIMEYKQPL